MSSQRIKTYLEFCSALAGRLVGVTELWGSGGVAFAGDLSLDHRELERTRLWRHVDVRVEYCWPEALPLVRVPLDVLYKTEADWHCDAEGRICYMLIDHWLYQYDCWTRGFSDREVSILMADWMMDSVARLLYYHYLGRLHDVGEWPAEWEFYSHNEEGRNQFFKKLWTGTLNI